MLVEMGLFTIFVLAGVLFRKRPKIHGPPPHRTVEIVDSFQNEF